MPRRSSPWMQGLARLVLLAFVSVHGSALPGGVALGTVAIGVGLGAVPSAFAADWDDEPVRKPPPKKKPADDEWEDEDEDAPPPKKVPPPKKADKKPSRADDEWEDEDAPPPKKADKKPSRDDDEWEDEDAAPAKQADKKSGGGKEAGPGAKGAPTAGGAAREQAKRSVAGPIKGRVLAVVLPRAESMTEDAAVAEQGLLDGLAGFRDVEVVSLFEALGGRDNFDRAEVLAQAAEDLAAGKAAYEESEPERATARLKAAIAGYTRVTFDNSFAEKLDEALLYLAATEYLLNVDEDAAVAALRFALDLNPDLRVDAEKIPDEDFANLLGNVRKGEIKPPMGRLEVQVDVRQARVFLDGILVEGDPLTDIGEVTAGEHQLAVFAPGHQPHRATINVPKGSKAREKVTMKPAPKLKPWQALAAKLNDKPRHPELIEPVREFARLSGEDQLLIVFYDKAGRGGVLSGFMYRPDLESYRAARADLSAEPKPAEYTAFLDKLVGGKGTDEPFVKKDDKGKGGDTAGTVSEEEKPGGLPIWAWATIGGVLGAAAIGGATVGILCATDTINMGTPGCRGGGGGGGGGGSGGGATLLLSF